ncbi:AzlD family protein [Oceanibacterium hippocampi]|uniref:Branched-chain amino acid transport protein (AzlD) n=1 Tax=Oceanibacterium hippocampi TaxID=745714 RepID=A0A1Y5T3P8_9PROT|nr:AzlD domain-containing protein [Oceanibacterium hippocampi]SLN53344.1 Branched-chain amino acid transport protein (AzlD) [Oceanibacterium hippocampi]
MPDQATLAAIMAMAALTYLTRTAGYWVARRLDLGGRIGMGLRAMPGAVLISLVAPTALAAGVAEAAASLVTVLFAARGAPFLLAVAAGVATVIAGRYGLAML